MSTHPTDLISREDVIKILRAAQVYDSGGVLDGCMAKVAGMPDVPFCMQDHTRCVVVGARNEVMARFAIAKHAAEFARSRPGYEHAKAYVALADPPVPELKGTVPLILYFGIERDADEFTAIAVEAKPDMVARRL